MPRGEAMTKPGSYVGDILLLFVGVFACSTSVIFIKQSTVHPALVPAYRLAIAALLMAPPFFREARKHPGWLTARRFAGMFIGAVLLALHFIAWTAGARMTPSTNGTLLVNLAPIAMPFILFFQLGERLNRRELAGTGLSLAGIIWLAVGDYRFDRGHFLGDIVCFVAMLLFALYLAAARVNRGIPSVWLYTVPLYAMAAVISLALAVPFTRVAESYPAHEYRTLIALALIPTIIGHTLLNRAMRNLRGQTVTLATSTQFIFASVLATAILGETPRASVYPAAALVAAGALIVILSTPQPAGPAPVGIESDAT
jgi:drug/metabolite transporter (DMT)-like permease